MRAICWELEAWRWWKERRLEFEPSCAVACLASPESWATMIVWVKSNKTIALYELTQLVFVADRGKV